MCADVLLTSDEMSKADTLTIAGGVAGFDLMLRAGRAVADEVRLRFDALGYDDAVTVHILCGLGNNGGDGFVAAQILAEAGYRVAVWFSGEPGDLKGDAALAYNAMGLPTRSLDPEELKKQLSDRCVVVDALLGAGLDRPVSGLFADVIDALNGASAYLIAVDLPSGVNGTTGQVMGVAVQAAQTVTFFRRKPGHFLLPGRACCGAVSCHDIGISQGALNVISPQTFHISPDLFLPDWSAPGETSHKYTRGHAGVLGGPILSNGAARLSAVAALRVGAGLVTLACPSSALTVYASHLTSVMVNPLRSHEEFCDFISRDKISSLVIGPGYGLAEGKKDDVLEVLRTDKPVVLDADALTLFQDDPSTLFDAIKSRAEAVVMTPHEGEFRRLFGSVPVDSGVAEDKVARARMAAQVSGAVVILKGADTVVAAPDGFAGINDNAPAWLATAGSGDVLAGIVCGLMAQGVSAFKAGMMAVWMHGEAGLYAGPGLIAEDLLDVFPRVIAALVEKSSQSRA
ncbi:MAG: NAD(P)H-hydrate dehydratase [Rhodobacteraceae bacterium]|nr:NAD(P)H-hydrate dehydratase [Paracoccaceae bacterium]